MTTMAKNRKEVTLWSMIKTSCKDHLNKPSSTRINGYWMTVLLTLIVICGVALEIKSAYKSTETYTLSNQMIALAVIILGQQALLLNIKKKAEETPFPTVEKLNGIINTEAGKIPNVGDEPSTEDTGTDAGADSEPITNLDSMTDNINMDMDVDAGTNGIM